MPTPDSLSAHGYAPGKLLLLGEHAVVYGAPAIGFPLSRGVHATIQAGHGQVTVSLDDGLIPPRQSEAAAAPHALVKRTFGPLSRSVDVHLHLEVPPMSGYGSSASVAVALLRAQTAWLKTPPLTRLDLWSQALKVEQEAHSRPSGVDPAIVVWNQLIEFKTEGSSPTITPLQLTAPIYILAGCCGDHGGTRASVSNLATLRERRPRLIGSAMNTLSEAAQAGSIALQSAEVETLGPALDLAHGVLSGLGLVGQAVDHCVRTARDRGALGAKMSGAGGQGGAWLAVFTDREVALKAQDQFRTDGYTVWLESLDT